MMPPKGTPDAIWDALAAAFGDPVTSSERGRMNRAAKELRDAGCTPPEVARRARKALQLWPTCSPVSVPANWSALGGYAPLPATVEHAYDPLDDPEAVPPPPEAVDAMRRLGL
jgi:hypothetical protein